MTDSTSLVNEQKLLGAGGKVASLREFKTWECRDLHRRAPYREQRGPGQRVATRVPGPGCSIIPDRQELFHAQRTCRLRRVQTLDRRAMIRGAPLRPENGCWRSIGTQS